MLLELREAIRVEELSTVEELEGLREEWVGLWSRCAGATPFQSPDWLIPWWKHLGVGELWVLAIRAEERLAGIAPIFIHTGSQARRRQVLLVGTGITDYLDFLVEPEHEDIVLPAFFEHLAANSHRWDECDFQQLAPGSALLTTPMPGWRSQTMVQEICPVLTLPETIEELPRVVPGHMLSKLDHCRRRAEKLGPVRVEFADEDSFSELFESLIQMHRTRWTARGQPGVLADDRLQHFHREAARRLLSTGTLKLYGLRIGERIVASLYGFVHGQRGFFYLSGFVTDLAQLSPGTILIGNAIEAAVRQGLKKFDFLRGREAYKYMWGAKGRLNYRRRVGHADRANNKPD